MTNKTEQAIEKIAKLIYLDGEIREPSGWEYLRHGQEKYGRIADQILNTLESLGLVFKDPDQSLPRWQDYHLAIDIFSYDNGQQDMLKPDKNGSVWVKVKEELK